MGIPIVPNMTVLEFVTTPLTADAAGVEPVHDCLCPRDCVVEPQLVAAIRALHHQAIPKRYEDVQNDDQFVQSQMFKFIHNMSEDDIFRDDVKRIGIEIEIDQKKKQKERTIRERMLVIELSKMEIQKELLEQPEGGEEEAEEADEPEQDGHKVVNLHRLRREDYGKDEWKEI